MVDRRDDGPATASMHDRASELLEAYVLDALEPDETNVVDAHLDEGCEGCDEEVGALRRVLGAIPLAGPLLQTSASLKQRVLDEVAAGDASARPRRAARSPRRSWGLRLAAPWGAAGRMTALAASVGVVAVAGLLAWNIVLQTEVDDLESQNSVLRGSVSRVEGGQAQTQEALSVAQARVSETEELLRAVDSRMLALLSLSGADAQTVRLSGTSVAPSASARLLWEPEEGVFIMVARGLSETTGEGGYVIWAETPDGLVRVGHFYADDSGDGISHGRLSFSLAEASNLTVSHEEDIDATTPSSEPVLVLAAP